ncbi:MAG: hypothetical protein COB30_000730, partial [Ectothiorhodospiraceae bacterium]|nr:hypothetical protein [Ectothiorhodospiraceae bacterium]
FGSQCIVVAVDSRKVGNKNIVHTHGGSKPTELETEAWIKKAVELGAGEILLTSMDHDGTKAGSRLISASLRPWSATVLMMMNWSAKAKHCAPSWN